MVFVVEEEEGRKGRKWRLGVRRRKKKWRMKIRAETRNEDQAEDPHLNEDPLFVGYILVDIHTLYIVVSLFSFSSSSQSSFSTFFFSSS